MRIWLVTIGEPVPVDDGSRDRLHRTGYLAHFLADHGHDVVWWTSTFDHFRKKHLFESDTDVEVNGHFVIRLLKGCGYRSNLSYSRVKDHRQVAARYAELARQVADGPDIIVSALPTIELCDESVRFGRERGVPVVLDMRDMWPDIFVSSVPGPARPPARLLLGPMFRQAARACANATAICGITEAFVGWGLRRGNRTAGPLDRAFPMGYLTKPPSAESIRDAEEFWDGLGIKADSGEFVACFIGAVGRQFDLETVIRAARDLRRRGKQARFVLCGSGDMLERYRRLAGDEPSVMFPGWVDSAQIHVLMRRASVGIDPMMDRYDFLATINNKAIEYMSAGLPVVSSPARGVLFDMLRDHRCGVSYNDGDSGGLADVLAGLIDDSGRLTEMAANSAQLFESTFTAERVYAEMMAYLEEVAAAKGASDG